MTLADDRMPGGSVGRRVNLGGSTTSDGSNAGLVVIGVPHQMELVENTGTYIYEGYAPWSADETDAGSTAFTIVRSTLSGSNITSAGYVTGVNWTGRATHTYSND